MNIPTPNQVKGMKNISLAGQAVELKSRLINALNAGNCSVSVPGDFKPECLKLIAADFAEAGWILVDHGISVSVRAK